MEIVHSRGCVYALEYHIVWCTKYRRKVIWPTVERTLHQILNEVADEQGVSIEEFNTDKDHIHMLIAATP